MLLIYWKSLKEWMRVDVNIYAIPQKADAVNIYTLSNLYFLVIVSFHVWRSQIYYLWSKDRDKLGVLTSNGQFPFWRPWSCVCVFPWGSGSVRVQWDIDHLIKRGAFLQMLWSCNMKSEVPSPRILWLPPEYTHTKETFAETTKCLLNKSEEQYSVSWRIKKSLTLP